MNSGHACMNTGGQTQDSRRLGVGYSLNAWIQRGSMTSSTAASSQHLDRHPCPGLEACLGSRLHFQRQPHTAIWDCFLSAGFPHVCLNLTSPNSNTEKRKGHPAHLSRAAVTQRAPEPVPPRAGCSHHTTEPPLEWNAPGGHHLLPGSHPSSSCAAPHPHPLPVLLFLSSPSASFPPFFAGFCSFFP